MKEKRKEQIIRTIMTIVKTDWMRLPPKSLKEIEKLYRVALKELNEVLASM